MAASDRSVITLRTSSQVSSVVMLGKVDSLPIGVPSKPPGFRFISLAGDTSIVDQDVARGFGLREPIDLSRGRAAQLCPFLQVCKPVRGPVIQQLVQLLLTTTSAIASLSGASNTALKST